MKGQLMGKEFIRSVLEELNSEAGDVLASAVVSTDGLPAVAVLRRGSDADRVGGLSAALLALGQRAAGELACGRFKQVLVEGDEGCILMVRAGEDALLLVHARQNAKLGLLFHHTAAAAKRLDGVDLDTV